MGGRNEAPVTKREVEEALRIMRAGKAGGLDGILRPRPHDRACPPNMPVVHSGNELKTPVLPSP